MAQVNPLHKQSQSAPEHGEGEIGGWYPQYQGNAFPGEVLEKICETHWQFEKYRAGLLPHVIVKEAAGKVVGKTGNSRIIEVTAKLENTGGMATNLARGADLPGNRADVAWLCGDRDNVTFLQGLAWQKAGILGGTLSIPGFDPVKSSAEVKWLVRVKGNTPLTVVVSSLKGGTDEREVVIKEEDGK